VDPDRAALLQIREAMNVNMDRYRGTLAGKPPVGVRQPLAAVFIIQNTFDFRRDVLLIEPLNLAPTPEHLIESRADKGRVLAAGFLDCVQMRFTIEQLDHAALIEYIARAFGATHRSGVQIRQYMRSEVLIGGISRGSISEIVESFGLDFSEN
jgi:hypothetical protein